MRYLRIFAVAAITILALSLSGCATPKAQLTSVWKDQTYQGGYVKKVLVIGAARKEAFRTYMEDEFVRQLDGRGNSAIASHAIIPFEKMLDKAAVAEKIKGIGVDGILITRVLYTLTAAPPLPKQPNWHEFYSESLGYEQGVSAPKISPGKTVARVEVNLYEAKAEKPIWTASSDVPLKDDDPKEEIKSFVTLVVQQLSQEKLIP